MYIPYLRRNQMWLDPSGFYPASADSSEEAQRHLKGIHISNPNPNRLPRSPCAFRAIRPPSPEENGHPFRSMAATPVGAKRRWGVKLRSRSVEEGLGIGALKLL